MGDSQLVLDVGATRFEIGMLPEGGTPIGQFDRPVGQFGTACRFGFFEMAQGGCMSAPLSATSEWDEAAGISFWLKGDGSHECGAIQLFAADDRSLRWEVWFQVDSEEWTKVVAPWCDFMPCSPQTPFLDPKHGYRPSRLGSIGFGKGIWRRTCPAYSFSVEQVCLEPAIGVDTTDYTPAAGGTPRVLARLKAEEPVTLVTIGDSLTDPRHWANLETAWPNILARKLRETYETDVKLVNTAVGGHQLTHGLALTPLWLPTAPEPDLVTVLYGANDYWNGMTPEHFGVVQRFAVDRLRRLTKGRSEILLLTCVPIRDEWEALDGLAEAVCAVAREKRTGLADVYSVFRTFGDNERQRPWAYAWDGHLGPLGHPLVAMTVYDAITSAS